MPNQDPLSLTGLVPLLGIDVWEVDFLSLLKILA